MNGNEPAMPSTPFLHQFKTPTDPIEVTMLAHLGLTKRELFAAMAMQGLLAKGSYDRFEDAACFAISCADELIRELSCKPK